MRFSDNVSSLLGSTEKHDFPLWSWVMSNVWRSDVRVPNLQESCREANSFVLNFDGRLRSTSQHTS